MNYFVDIDYSRKIKESEKICGDVFLLSKDENSGRIGCILSDGLGSGVKAHVLARLTATMGVRFLLGNMDAEEGAHIIMDTLPVCSERKISYATFTMVDIPKNGEIEIIEYDNPPCLFIRDGKAFPLTREKIPLNRKKGFKEEALFHSKVKPELGDRLIFYSDGVAQAGMGTHDFPFGWTANAANPFILGIIEKNPEISSRELCEKVTARARQIDHAQPKDDITCGSLYFRKPRNLLVVTGPPNDPDQDDYYIAKVRDFSGRKILSGGTTATIIGRGLEKKVRVDMSSWDAEIPPAANMEGIDLITEGMITLTRVAKLLKHPELLDQSPQHAAWKMVNLILDSDKIDFLVGTRINEAHQDPNMPQEIGIRRTLMKRIVEILEKQYAKETHLEFV